ncbi:MAG: thymidylate synthase (FAD) [Caudoviricetes sp.]|nr:MAG: thymidylate synthase (FAD) [Caudoviricetes sp.]
MNNVKLVGITHPQIRIPVEDAEPGTFMLLSPESFIAYVARVSNPANQNNVETSERLLKYLVKNKHWSPFEMVHVVMEINTTRDIARQILRHRSFSFQEFSQRYAEVDDKSFTIKEARLQDAKNRQNSIETSSALTQEIWEQYQEHTKNAAIAAYKWAINNGLAKEVARSVLPEGITNSRLYMSGTLRSWIHYCDLRMGNGTQKEHRLIANECWDVIVKEFPSLKNVLENNL